MSYEKSIILHQQDGGVSVQAFAYQQGISLGMARYYVKTGRVIGARQDARSKKWTIYPPAKLTVSPRSKERLQAAGFDVGTSPHGLSAGLPLPVQETPEASSLSLHAKPLLTFLEPSISPASPQGAHGHAVGFRCQKPEAYTSPEVQSALRVIREAAARQLREGVHYLRLEGCEFLQLYAALNHERNRIRKLIGKGLVDACNLRASDSVWQKLQAMCQEGKLL